MKPKDFWESTFDEVFLVIRGKVQDWRVLRMCTYNIVRISADPKRHFRPEDLFHLAYDDELMDDGQDNEALFEQGKLIRLPGIKYAGE